MFSQFTSSLRGMWGVNLGQSPTGLDLLTRGPKPGPASWLGMQVTQLVASATNWCLSPRTFPPHDLTSHAWLGLRDSQLVTSVTHGSSSRQAGQEGGVNAQRGVLSWPYTRQLVNGVRLMSRVRKHLAKEPAWGQVLTLAWGSYLDMIIKTIVTTPLIIFFAMQ